MNWLLITEIAVFLMSVIWLIKGVMNACASTVNPIPASRLWVALSQFVLATILFSWLVSILFVIPITAIVLLIIAVNAIDRIRCAIHFSRPTNF